MRGDRLDVLELNRATLARQLLLRRAPLHPLAAIDHLVGLQAQVPGDPYVALWARIDGFDPLELSALLEERRAVRTVLMRATIHLVTAEDALLLRPLVQPVLEAELSRHREHAPVLRELHAGAALAHARTLVEERPRTTAELREALAERVPPEHAPALAYAARNRLALVQVPPRGLWRRSGGVRLTTLESWVRRPLHRRPALEDVVLRYLAAFGPASAADASTWSRLTGLRPVLESLRPKLVTFRDGRGRELFDPPDAPRPDAATPAPPRFIPEYDNVLLSHADRGRFVSDAERKRLAHVDGLGHGTLLVDGRAAGRWRAEGDGDRQTLVVRHLGLPRGARDEVAAEAERLVRFLSPESARVPVRFERLP